MFRVLRNSLITTLVAWVTVACLLLPALLIVIPSPATAAELAYFQDMGTNNCMDLGGSKEKMPQHEGRQCCILCLASAFPVPPSVDAATAVAIVQSRIADQGHAAVTGLSRSVLAFAATAPITGRGPPA
jgi:hypothetical protein